MKDTTRILSLKSSPVGESLAKSIGAGRFTHHATTDGAATSIVLPGDNHVPYEIARYSLTCGGPKLARALRDVVKKCSELRSGGDAVVRGCEHCHDPVQDIVRVVLKRLARILDTIRNVERHHVAFGMSDNVTDRMRSVPESVAYSWSSKTRTSTYDRQCLFMRAEQGCSKNESGTADEQRQDGLDEIGIEAMG